MCLVVSRALCDPHFDHRGPQARLEAARLIRAFVTKKAGDLPVIITGDFNAAPGSGPHKALLDPMSGSIQLTDTYAVAPRDAPEADQGTAHGFKDKPVTNRIDWILCTDHFSVESAAIDRHRVGPLFPSDHYAVNAVLHWR